MSFRRMEDEGKSGRFSEREINKLERGFARATAASEGSGSPSASLSAARDRIIHAEAA